MPLRSWMLLLMSAGAGHAVAQPAPPPACETPESRQFDFWIGDWDVFGGPGGDTPVGRNTISKVANGCALREHWVNARGLDGHSLNAYERQTQAWTQFWIGSDGVVLRLRGGLRADGAMAMSGELPDGKGGTQLQRIVWTPMDDGAVEQRWDTSDDAGRSWQTSFVGIYRRRPAQASP